jgi:hypothetical protein
MTSSFGITPQRQLRDYTVQPEKPAALPRPAEPVSEPQRLGGQLLDARRFQQDTKTAETLKSIEQFLGSQGVFAKESAVYFENYKQQKKEEALNLYKQESLAYGQSIENSKDVKTLEQKGDSEAAKQLRVSNPWVNYFYHTLKAEDASSNIALNLAAWGQDNLDDLARLQDPAARSAAIAKQAKQLMQPYQDIPSAFVTGKIDPVIASTQSKLNQKIVERSYELKNLDILDVSKQHMRNGLALVAKAAKFSPNDINLATSTLQGVITQTMSFLTDVHGYKEQKVTATIAKALDNLWLDVDENGLNDIGEFLTGDAVAKALAGVKTKDGISLSSLVYDDKGNTIGELVQKQYAEALGREEKRSTARQANITRQAKDWERSWEQRAIEWKLQNPDATPEQINAQIKSEISAITSDGNQLQLSNKSLPEIQKFVKDIYTPMDELVSPQQMIDDKTYADQLNREGKPFPTAFLNSLRGKPYMAELVTENARAVGSSKEAVTKSTRANLLKDLKESLKDRFLTSDSMKAVAQESSDTKEAKKKYTNSAIIQANRFMDVVGAKEINDAVYEARQKGLDLRDPRVVNDIFTKLNDKFSKRPEFSNPEFYYNINSDNKKPLGAPTGRVPSISFSKQRGDGSWEITNKHNDNLLTWSRMARTVLGNNPTTARNVIKTEFIFNEQELQALSAALHTGRSDQLPTSIREKLENFNYATNNRIPLSQVMEEQVLRYKGSTSDEVKALLKRNAALVQQRIRRADAAPANARQTDLEVSITNWRHDHRSGQNGELKRNAIDAQFRTAAGQLANNPVPSPVSGDVIYNSAVSGQVSGYGHVVVIRAATNGNGYKAGDRILIAHGSKVLVKGNRVTAGQNIMLTGGPGSTTGTADSGVIHFQVFKPGSGAFPNRSEQHPQDYQNKFVRGALFPLFQHKSYPSY